MSKNNNPVGLVQRINGPFKRDSSQWYFGLHKILVRIAQIDYKFQLEQNEDGRFMVKGTKDMLISPSRILKIVHEYRMFNVPDFVLTKAAGRGKRLMENIEYSFKNQVRDLSSLFFLEGDKEPFMEIWKYIKENRITVLDVEKYIHNGTCMGIIDMVIKQNGKIYIVEIKTRTKCEIRDTDLFQIKWYSNLFNKCPAQLWIIDKENVLHTFKVNLKNIKKDFDIFIKGMNIFLPLDIETPAKTDISAPVFLPLEEDTEDIIS